MTLNIVVGLDKYLLNIVHWLYIDKYGEQS